LRECTFHEWAAHSIGSSAWAKAYYEQQRAKGKPRNTVVRALAFKWIRILFRCWKDLKPYSEEVYKLSGPSSPTRRQKLICATPVEKLRRLQQNHFDYLLTDHLRCQLTVRPNG
jgi:hypothetical protein